MYAIHGIDWNVGHSFTPSYTGLSIHFKLFVGIRQNPSTERPLSVKEKPPWTHRSKCLSFMLL
jgi:hypothetical protein